VEPVLLILIGLGLALTALAAVVLIRTLTVRDRARPPSIPTPESEDESPEIDVRSAAERLAGAVRIPTTAEDGGSAFQALHTYLREAFPRVHETLNVETIARHSLLHTWRGTDPTAPPILLLGHLDVVPADPETVNDWTHPPFSGRITATHIWGRGTLDDKQSVLGLLEAVEALLKAGFRPRRTLVLAFGHDEETGGQGAQVLAAHLREAGMHFAFALDEGMAVTEGMLAGIDVPAALVGTAEKRSFNIRLVVDGQGGHTSMPPTHTAIGRLSTAIHRLERHPRPLRWTPPVRQMFTALAPAMTWGYRIAFANLWLVGGLIKRTLASTPRTRAIVQTTTAASIIHAGVKANVLPARAEAVINCRILPGETAQQMVDHVRTVIDDPAVRVEPLDRVQDAASAVADVTGPSYRTLAGTIRQIFPDAVVAPALVTGATDSRHYESLCDAVYRFSPMRVTPDDLARIHGVDERIEIAAYARAIRFYARLILNSDRDAL
jgi:carboxypeptidase PM20D1